MSGEIEMKSRSFLPKKLWFIAIAMIGLSIGAVLITNFSRITDQSLLSSLNGSDKRAGDSTTTTQLLAILHYATSRVVPQQTPEEIRVTFDVLQSVSPCNFLVYGLGYDSIMWSSFNPRGKTLFLEEEPEWIQNVLKEAPNLRAQLVVYRTQVKEADDLIKSYRSEPDCLPGKVYLRGNTKCKLALTGLSDEVYAAEWDLIMIDAPTGYFPEASGRMGPIFSAGVMARARTRPGVTHVFVHNVNRKEEKMFTEEFLCWKYLKKIVGKLGHFEIPSLANVPDVNSNSSFC